MNERVADRSVAASNLPRELLLGQRRQRSEQLAIGPTSVDVKFLEILDRHVTSPCGPLLTASKSRRWSQLVFPQHIANVAPIVEQRRVDPLVVIRRPELDHLTSGKLTHQPVVGSPFEIT